MRNSIRLVTVVFGMALAFLFWKSVHNVQAQTQSNLKEIVDAQ